MDDEYMQFKQEQAYRIWKLEHGWTQESDDPLEILINEEQEKDDGN